MSSTTTTTQPDQAFYLVKQLAAKLTERGMPLTTERILHYINNGQIKATKCFMRPKLWTVSHQELERILNQGR